MVWRASGKLSGLTEDNGLSTGVMVADPENMLSEGVYLRTQ
jgi:hypothetical protein